MKNLNQTTIKEVRDLQNTFRFLLQSDSNIDVVWALEKLINDKAIQKSVDLIKKSLR